MNLNLRQFFLILTGVGLIPIALSYGLMPIESMKFLFDIDVVNTEATHIYRAVMCLYLGLVVFWLMGAAKSELRQPALYSLVVFMLGLGAGRILSILIDGVPHWLLLVYLGLEVTFGTLGLLVLKRPE